jgi:hypothetical protein
LSEAQSIQGHPLGSEIIFHFSVAFHLILPIPLVWYGYTFCIYMPGGGVKPSVGFTNYTLFFKSI